MKLHFKRGEHITVKRTPQNKLPEKIMKLIAVEDGHTDRARNIAALDPKTDIRYKISSHDIFMIHKNPNETNNDEH